MERYHVLELVGTGAFGRVYKGRERGTGRIVALKFLPKRQRTATQLKRLHEEIAIMRRLRHPNIIALLDAFETEDEVVAVTEYAPGELFQILEDDGALPLHQVGGGGGMGPSHSLSLRRRPHTRTARPPGAQRGGAARVCAALSALGADHPPGYEAAECSHWPPQLHQAV